MEYILGTLLFLVVVYKILSSDYTSPYYEWLKDNGYDL